MHITLRPVTTEDSALLWHLLKERPPYANITHGKAPSMNEHLNFIKSEPYHAWYIIEGEVIAGMKDIGAIHLTKDDEIGIAILRKFWRQGGARASIKELMKLQPRKKYLANIAPTNMHSQRLFKQMKFKTLQYTLVLEND